MAMFSGNKDNHKKIRDAVVGLGWIAQEVILPGFKGAKYSELAPLVTDDPEKAAELGNATMIAHVVSYEAYDGPAA